MARRRYNFHVGTLLAGIDNAQTTITSADFANLPAVTGPDVLVITLDPDQVAGAPELVWITAHTASSTSVTATRGQESTAARAHLAGVGWTHAPTVLDFEDDLVDGTTITSVAGRHGVPARGITPVQFNAAFADATARDAAIPTPQAGDQCFLISTGENLTYVGATDGWCPPWNTAWGRVTDVAVTTPQTVGAATADLTSLTVTATAKANRRWKISLTGAGGMNTSTTAVAVSIQTGASGAGTQLSVQNALLLSLQGMNASQFAIVTTTAASLSYHGRVTSSATNFLTQASSTNPWRLLIEDIGPNGAPS